ncbi:MAG: class I adenylate-forming enzyme family protein [Stellaceae bacterium]
MAMSETPVSATTADYVAFHAAQRPDAVAAICAGRTIVYADFDRDLAKVASALRGLDVAAGTRVAIGATDVYLHWLLLIACEHLGAVSTSYFGDEVGDRARFLAGVDLVLAEPTRPVAGPIRHVAMTADWLRGVFATTGALGQAARTPPEHPVRITRTSGTTGASKRLVLTRRMYEAWIDRWRWSLGITRETRFLLTMSFASTGKYALANSVLRTGGAVVAARFDSVAAVAGAVAAHAIDLVILMPIQLKQILDKLPPGFTKPPRLTIGTIGAAASDALVERAMRHLATEVIAYYGSNEIPFIAESRTPTKTDVATVFPWVQAEVVDDEGMPLPHGALGRIRLKADTMATGYLDDPETSGRMFRDGWFYPGDAGVLRGEGRLQVVGRADDLMNIGGQKLPPSGIEAVVASRLPDGDIGVCSLRNAEGIESLYVALAAPQSDDELRRRIAGVFEGLGVGDVHLVRLARIPRNANGKIMRADLKEAVLTAVGVARG